MSNLQDLLNLAGSDGKVFVVSESGDVKFVILGAGEYQKLLLGKLKRQVEDVEEINRRILEAQLTESAVEPAHKAPRVDMRSEVIDANFSMSSFSGDAEAIKPGFDDI